MTIESWFHRNIQEKPTLKILTKLIFESFRLAFKSKRDLNLENLAFRQQLAKQQQKIKRPKMSGIDRLFWVWLSNIWLDWRWKYSSKPGRSKIIIVICSLQISGSTTCIRFKICNRKDKGYKYRDRI